MEWNDGVDGWMGGRIDGWIGGRIDGRTKTNREADVEESAEDAAGGRDGDNGGQHRGRVQLQ